MSPTAEQMIIRMLENQEERMDNIVAAIGRIEGRNEAKDKACTICNMENMQDHETIYKKITEAQNWRAVHEALEKNEEKKEAKAEVHSLNTFQKWYYFVLTMCGIGGAIAGIKELKELWATLTK